VRMDDGEYTEISSDEEELGSSEKSVITEDEEYINEEYTNDEEYISDEEYINNEEYISDEGESVPRKPSRGKKELVEPRKRFERSIIIDEKKVG